MTLLAVKNLTKKYDRNPVVNDVSFEFHEGKCIALIGPNGAGKTTILRTLAGLLKPTSGNITFNGKANADFRAFIGYLPQHPVFYSWMTGLEFLIFSAEISNFSNKEAKERAEVLLEKVGIAEAKNKPISKYSGGMKQRLGIAQAIIHKPKLVMLDEPVSALDPIGRREVLTLMEDLKQEMTILFSTHILGDADEISDELLLLHQGEIVESGPVNELRKKYQTSMIELVFQSDVEKYTPKVESLPSVSYTKVDRHKLFISTNDIMNARQEILSIAAKEDWPLNSFTLNRASLEDMFMKVVNQ